jgi:hypothetical protein
VAFFPAFASIPLSAFDDRLVRREGIEPPCATHSWFTAKCISILPSTRILRPSRLADAFFIQLRRSQTVFLCRRSMAIQPAPENTKAVSYETAMVGVSGGDTDNQTRS